MYTWLCRADVKQYIGLPTPAAIFKIFHSCLSELMRVGIITPNRQILDLRALEIMRFTENEATRLSLRLRDIARYIKINVYSVNCWHQFLYKEYSASLHIIILL